MANPESNPDLHGNVPDQCSVALLLIDVLNGLEFEGSEQFADRAIDVAKRIAALRQRARSTRTCRCSTSTTITLAAGART